VPAKVVEIPDEREPAKSPVSQAASRYPFVTRALLALAIFASGFFRSADIAWRPMERPSQLLSFAPAAISGFSKAFAILTASGICSFDSWSATKSTNYLKFE
jgi:hypothetical protein